MAHKGPEAGANQEPPRTPQQQTGKVVADYNLMPAARGVTSTPPQAWLMPQCVEDFEEEGVPVHHCRNQQEPLDGPSTRPLGGQTKGVLPLDG